MYLKIRSLRSRIFQRAGGQLPPKSLLRKQLPSVANFSKGGGTTAAKKFAGANSSLRSQFGSVYYFCS
ncbi:hypothetical protein [Methanolapillus ohkumae]|uniref:hypothetical protein n=1 Tax=Methanolapillus ohkumae TaxID=3028298 RepID=UPI0030B8773F